MRILADRHHEALFNSLQYLLEDRLGHELYHPHGISWFDSGKWLIGNPYGETARNTALQFLESAVPSDGTEVLKPYRGITLEEFIDTHFDVMIASYIDHIPLYKQIIDAYQPGCKLVAQIGNEWPVDWGLVDNLMASVAPFKYPRNKNVVFYHQEFKIPQPQKAPFNKKIKSFVNALNINTLFYQDWLDFRHLEALLPEFTLLSHGGGCRDGSLSQSQVMDSMQDTMFALHLKTGGDGYGHVIHSLMALGVPVIYRSSQYKGKLAEPLLINCVTGFDLDAFGSIERLAEGIRSITPTQLNQMSTWAMDNFNRQVDFSSEAKELADFFDRLI